MLLTKSKREKLAKDLAFVILTLYTAGVGGHAFGRCLYIVSGIAKGIGGKRLLSRTMAIVDHLKAEHDTAQSAANVPESN